MILVLTKLNATRNKLVYFCHIRKHFHADIFKKKNFPKCCIFAGGYYATNNKKNTKLQVVVLNTNLWYSSNKLINNTIEQDPGGQFKFLESILERAVDDQVKVYYFFALYDYCITIEILKLLKKIFVATAQLSQEFVEQKSFEFSVAR